MADERLVVEFPSEISTYRNCMCDACHGIGQVIKLELPQTKYFNGRVLSTRYDTYWLCPECRDMLVKALDGRMEDA